MIVNSRKNHKTHISKYLAITLFFFILIPQAMPTSEYTIDIPQQGEMGVGEIMSDIMQQDRSLKESLRGHNHSRQAPRVKKDEARPHKKQNHSSPHIASFPHHRSPKIVENESRSPQKLGVNFTAATLADAGYFPPDSMGAVGPTQFILAINGLFKSFNKATGLADGVMDLDPDVFFSSIVNGSSVSDPRIRYDRHSQRWFIVAINVKNANNRVLIAVSGDATITHDTVWGFFYINAGAGNFFDYPTLGIDANALYIGGNTFTNSSETGEIFVVRKSSILADGPLVFTTFHNIVDPNTGIGLYVPQGVDNFDIGNDSGYFIAVDNATFGTLIIRRVLDPGGTPILGSNIALTVT